MRDALLRIRDLRRDTGYAFAKAYQELVHSPFSELDLKDRWLRHLQTHLHFHDHGWYSPPPDGIICSFGKVSDNYAALRTPSFRTPSSWPAQTEHDVEDISLVYASPIDRASNLIGDWGLSIYSGSKSDIKEHFENTLRATLYVAQSARSGMSFKELYTIALETGMRHGLSSTNVQSISDKVGTNIGHTIPLSYADTPNHEKIENAKSNDERRDAISAARIFINDKETKVIEDNMAFVIEPRYSTDKYPDILFHMTLIFINGEKEICHEYRPALEVAGMQHLMLYLP